MSIKETIKSEKIAAMKARNSHESKVLGSILASIKQYEIDNRVEAGDSEVTTIIKRMVKQRNESISQFSAANRQDLVEVETGEISIIERFLPEQLSEDAIIEAVNLAIDQVGSATAKDMGAIMKIVKASTNGKADMGLVSKIVKSKIS